MSASSLTANWSSRSTGGSPSTRCRCAFIRRKAASANFAAETPARLVLFDCLLSPDGAD